MVRGRAAPEGPVRPRRGLTIVVGLFGAVLCALALPAAGARIAELTGRAAALRLAEGGQLTEGGLRRLLASNDRARAWLAEPGFLKDLGRSLHGIATGEAAVARSPVALLTEARAALVEGLEGSPVDPIAWLQLAQIEAALLDLARAAAALRASQRLGPVTPEIAVGRTALALGLWEWLAEPVRERAGAEFASAVRSDPATLARVARATGTVEALRERLAGETNALAALERELAALARAVRSDGGEG